MNYVLQTKNVSKEFSGKRALEDVSISVEKGDIYGFIGENGAGKTTLMRIICGLASPTGGEITLFGSRNLASQRHRIGSTFDNPTLFPEMTALENMETQRLLLGVQNRNVCVDLLELAGINNTGKMKAKNFSLGMKQRLMIALSLLGEPEFLILDEPTNGLDPMGLKEVRDFLQRLNETTGLTLFISSHILGELEKIATRYGIISHGKLVDEFRTDELLARYEKNLVIHTSDLQKAESVVRETLPNVECTRTSKDAIRISGHVEEAGRINKMLVESGITVNALIPEDETLEDYMLNLMRGKAHV